MKDESNFYRLDLKSPEVETFNILVLLNLASRKIE